jgi:hypothetical protein
MGGGATNDDVRVSGPLKRAGFARDHRHDDRARSETTEARTLAC